MKKSKIIFWSTAALIIAVLFIILMEVEMKKAKIITWSVVAALIAALFVALLATPNFANRFNFNFFNFSSYKYPNADKYNIGNTSISDNIQYIDINWISGNVEFNEYDGDKIIIEENCSDELSDEQKLHWYVDENGKLYIKYAASGLIKAIFKSKSLTVKIPHGTLLSETKIETVSASVHSDLINSNNFTLNTVSGSIETNNISCRNYDANSVSGKIELNKIYCSQIDVGTVSGRIDASHISSSNIDINSVSGKITFEFEEDARPSKAEFNSTSGSINISLSEDVGFTAKIETVSGSFNTDLQCTQSKKTYIHGDGYSNFQIDTVSGNIKISAVK